MSDPVPTAAAVTELTDSDLAILSMERRRWLHQGVKDEAIKVELGLSRVRYDQVLNALLDRPEAYLHDPPLIKRLRRLREQRQQRRSPRAGAG